MYKNSQQVTNCDRFEILFDLLTAQPYTPTTFAADKFCLIELIAYIIGVVKCNSEETSAVIALLLEAVDVCTNTNTNVWGFPPRV